MVIQEERSLYKVERENKKGFPNNAGWKAKRSKRSNTKSKK